MIDDPRKNKSDTKVEDVLDDGAKSVDSADQADEKPATTEAQKLSASEELSDSEAAREEAQESKEPVAEVKEEQPKKPEDKPEADASDDPAKWYIVHTYSGHENKVTKSIKQRVASLGFEDRIFDIIVPTRNTIKVSQGKKESVKEKIFPGYVLIKMILTDESWLLIRTTQGVTAFIGAGNKPTPISDKEVEAIKKFMETEEPLYKTSFTIGEAVKIVDGPFADFLGTIDEIDEVKGKVKVLVSIFGRETPVELDFLQVNKL